MSDISAYILYASLFSALYFQIFLLVTFFEGKEKVQKKKTEDELPTVTMVVPCFNESRTLRATVESLLALDYPERKLGIFIVDDGSSDNTYEIARSLAKEFPTRVVAHTKANGGKHTALNLAIETVSSDFIGCLDADSFVNPDALKKMISYFDDPKVMAVTPAMHVHSPTNILQMMQKAEYNLGIFTKRVFGMLDAIHVTPGPFSIFRHSVFEHIGVFKKAHSTEDMEIAFRIQAHGYKIANCHTAKVFTVTPNTIKKLYRQRTRWVYGFINNAIDYRFIFFRKKYGNMGMFTLPFAVIGAVFALYLTANIIYDITKIVVNNIDRWTTVGITFHMPHWDLFFLNVESLTFIAIALVGLTAVIVFMGKKVAEGSVKPSKDILYFFLFYGFLAPIWLSKAVYNTIFAKNTPWR